jgi:hypothetical protein
MNLNNLKTTDLFGRFFLKAPNGGEFIGYYSSLDAIRPLVVSEEWMKNVTGFFINVANVAGNFDAVRLSYWTASPKQIRQVVDEFVGEHGLKSIKEPPTPVQASNSELYGGEELRFRRFLSTYTLIGLDITKADLLHARCLLATFRWQVMRNRQPYKPHFIWTFENYSPFYNSLAETEKDQLWLDLAHWPNPPQMDWAHFLVNMVLGCDWNNSLGIGRELYLDPKPQLTISGINKIIERQGFQIPENWQPTQSL